MVNKNKVSAPTGNLACNHEHKQLELNGRLLQLGDWIEIRIFGHWLPGKIAVDTSGWYLLTPDQIGIRLSTGITARLYELIVDY
jgi:hypothetical protein